MMNGLLSWRLWLTGLLACASSFLMPYKLEVSTLIILPILIWHFNHTSESHLTWHCLNSPHIFLVIVDIWQCWVQISFSALQLLLSPDAHTLLFFFFYFFRSILLLFTGTWWSWVLTCLSMLVFIKILTTTPSPLAPRLKDFSNVLELWITSHTFLYIFQVHRAIGVTLSSRLECLLSLDWMPNKLPSWLENITYTWLLMGV